MLPVISRHQSEFDAVRKAAAEELSAIRTGRANPAVVEHLTVNVSAYGTTMPLQQLASITVPEARVILISPWDPNVAKDIERAIIDANLGLNPVVDGSGIRLVVPQLTTETRAELLKFVNAKVEAAKVRLRTNRDKIREEIVKAERAKELTEDDRFAAFEELDSLIKQLTAELTEMGERKAKEITTI